MFSAIGLTIDLVGAFVLARGLFRHSLPLYPGWSRSPDAAAEDHAYGAIGFGCLAVGFACQALPAFGANWPGGPESARTAAVITLVLAGMAAYIGYGVAYIALLRREVRFANRTFSSAMGEHVTRTWRPRMTRFWHHV